ncbi:MAG: hypothetical protein ACYDH3_00100 [Candidatus Aminicenantales bacterium]
MRKIIIDIDGALKTQCGECRYRSWGLCDVFNECVIPNGKLTAMRLPACIEAERVYSTMNNLAPKGCHDVEEYYKDEPTEAEKAEAKLARLVEAAKNLVHWCDKNDWGCIPGKIETDIKAALKEIEHE